MSPPWSLALLLLSSLASLTSVLAQATPSCPTTPQDPACAAFRLSDANATAALDSLCAQMDAMPGCSIRKQCAAANPAAAAIPDPYCNPMSLLADICHVDMPTMADCKPYVSMCGSASTASSSLNLQCKEPTSAPIPALLTSKAATQNIHSICTEMSMPGCEACTINSPTDIYPRNNCDLIATYALLCKAMPDMKQCADWKTMCAATPGLSYCSSSSSTDPPVMKMFFHTGFADYVLFETWVPRTAAQYVGTWIAIFLMGILYEGWNALVATSEVKFLNPKATDGHSQSRLVKGAEGGEPFADKLRRGLFRGAAKAVTVTAAYALMLITMTFNVGLFFAVVFGLAVGTALFSDVHRAALKHAVLNETNREELCC